MDDGLVIGRELNQILAKWGQMKKARADSEELQKVVSEVKDAQRTKEGNSKQKQELEEESLKIDQVNENLNQKSQEEIDDIKAVLENRGSSE